MSAKKQQTHNTAYDIQLLFPVLFLVGIGIVMVYSASSALALKKFGSDYFFLKKRPLLFMMPIPRQGASPTVNTEFIILSA